VQVKSGKKYKRAVGYAIPIDDHYEDWKNFRIPVLGVVYDRETERLFWINITRELNEASTAPTWVQVPLANELSSETIRGFAAEVEMYIDTKGMRLPGGIVESELLATLRQMEAREYKPSLNNANGTIGDDPNLAPNPLFEGMADWVLKHEHRLKKAKKFAWLVFLLLGMVAIWPYHVRFVRTFSDTVNPYVWTLALHSFTFYIACIALLEISVGRFPRETGKWLFFILGNFSWIPFAAGDGGDKTWGMFWIWAGILIPSVGSKFVVIHYVRAAIQRRRAAGTSAR
jgi:hypothetical protein